MPPKMRLEVDDAKLRALIQATKGKRPVRVVADGVEYGLYQEMGTVYVPAQPFMKPAVEEVRKGFGQAFKGAITLRQAEEVVEKAARDVERGAKMRAPVDTGALKNSIHVVSGDAFETEFEVVR